jgi:AraC-like DNA-binding protein
VNVAVRQAAVLADSAKDQSRNSIIVVMTPPRSNLRPKLLATSRSKRGQRHGANAHVADFKPISQSGEVRVGPVMAIPKLLRKFQVRPSVAFDTAKVDPKAFQHPDRRISIEEIGQLLAVCARLAKCETFGLLVGMQFTLTNFGPLGDLLRNSVTVGEAISHLLRHLHWHDKAAAPLLLAQQDQNVLLGYSLYHNRTSGIAQIYDAAVAIAFRILQELCGRSWRPHHVQLMHRRPHDEAAYRQLFRARVQFDAQLSGVVFSPIVLGRLIESANPVIHERLVQSFEALERLEPLSCRERVESVLHQVLWSGDFSLEAVAYVLGTKERTLRRWLADEGESFRQILMDTRGEIAAQLLENSNLPVANIAAALRYDDPTAFTRAFKNWAGVSPAAWRKEHQSFRA